MIVLFDEFETKFDSLGLGILHDATQCSVTEELNGGYSLEMLYSVSGQFYDKLNLNKIIYVKPNPFDEPQPFRIKSISKPIKGHVTINADHISYDMNGIPVTAIDAKTLADVFSLIKKNSLVKNNFNFRTDIFSSRSFRTTQPYNMRAVLMGDDENSLVGVYDAELKFDKFDVRLLSKRGADRGTQICYGQNMTDLTHEITSDRLYNGIYPYYHKESTSTETETEETFKQVYIVGTKEYAEDWFSFTKGGEAYHPLDSTPVQVATEGNHFQEVYCWNETYQKYEKKIYNESVQLIQNVVAPGWIKIEWSSFPNVKCVANAKGYFKGQMDTDWGDVKGVGDVIFEGNILKEGISGIMSNMTIYYSEVIPSSKESTSKEVNEIKEVTLDDPIIWLNTIDAKTMTHDRILMVDLTDKFDDEEPTQQQLLVEANKYISEMKLGNITTSTKVSYIDIQENQNKYKNFSHVELGDTVKIVYNDIGVNTELRVISTNFNVLTEKYNSIELGTKTDKFSSQSVENGDDISSLTNDVGYADVTTVNKLIAQTVTAEFINATNATLSKAQIEELEVAKIKMPGVIEASQYVIDDLVATMLTAQNAKIAQTLEAGTVKVSGNVNVYGGSIDISDSAGGTTFFSVDKKGNLKANSVDITGGSLEIGDNFIVTNDGYLTAARASISGDISIESGKIAIGENAFSVENDGTLSIGDGTFEVSPDGTVTIKKGSINIANAFSVNDEGKLSINGDVFEVDPFGNVNIKQGAINLGNGAFHVDNNGNMTANSVNITGGQMLFSGNSHSKFKVNTDGSIISTAGTIGPLTITENTLTYSDDPLYSSKTLFKINGNRGSHKYNSVKDLYLGKVVEGVDASFDSLRVCTNSTGTETSGTATGAYFSKQYGLVTYERSYSNTYDRVTTNSVIMPDQIKGIPVVERVQGTSLPTAGANLPPSESKCWRMAFYSLDAKGSFDDSGASVNCGEDGFTVISKVIATARGTSEGTSVHEDTFEVLTKISGTVVAAKTNVGTKTGEYIDIMVIGY